jgi:glutamate formiminotransferase / formiminotetrahydrofolate cyclodeaminase
MPQPLVECIPNFSEARRPEIIQEIMSAIQNVAHVHLLDRHSDLDHNRTVLTFVGAPEAVEEAAFQAIARAASLIDLDQHQGEHPRIGATDVVPFVPITGIKMEDCVEMARRLGRRVGEELGIPVYLYEEAATRPDRQNLENIRRGQYEALKEEISTQPGRAPDFGPSQVGPAGATVIGARHPLIAFNVYLTTDEVSTARKIAKAIRHSSGGLRYVKALGLLVEGRAQVSMNLTNYRETPLARVVETIRREAARYGVSIHHSELVGLIPQDALQDASIWYLQLDAFRADQVLEQRLADAVQPLAKEETNQAEDRFFPGGEEFLDALAAGTATPGGGSAAAYAGAMAAALASMVAHLTIGKKKYAPVEAQMQRLLEETHSLRAHLIQAVQRDAVAFDAVMAAYRMPQASAGEKQARQNAIQSAIWKATDEPLNTARTVIRVMELLSQLIQTGNLNAISDAASGFALAQAAFRGAGLNVRINLKSLEDASLARRIAEDLQSLDVQARGLEEEVSAALRQRGELETV